MPRRHSGERYRGINILILWGKAEAAGYRAPHWMTFKQALEYGGNVRKGEKGTRIVYTNRVTESETNEVGEDVERSFGFLKSYTVFNVEQIENLPAKFTLKEPVATDTPEAKDWTAYAAPLAWFEAIPAEVIHRGDKAFYIPSLDRIELPERDNFFSPAAYFSTRAHETTHWTKAETRLNRDFGTSRFGDSAYAMEELVAELGLVPAIRENHAPYIAHWLVALKNDSKALLSAAAKASNALEFMSKFQQVSKADQTDCAQAA